MFSFETQNDSLQIHFRLDTSNLKNSLLEVGSVSSSGAAVLQKNHLLSQAVAGCVSKSSLSCHTEMQRFLKTPPEVKARYSLNFLRYRILEN